MAYHFNQGLFQATKEVLLSAGVKEDFASKVAGIVASDDPTLPNLGRTEADQEIINQVLPYVQSSKP